MAQSALIVVDIQNDFLPGGSLAVPKSQEVIPLINELMTLPFDCRVATQDWHPKRHCSFASRWGKTPGEQIVINNQTQVLWPDHCIQGMHGAAFSSDLDMTNVDFIVHKGTDKEVDSYSTFFDNHKLRTTALEAYLRKNDINTLFFVGLATEYCVFYSVMDALSLGFTVYVIIDACRGVELNYGDIEKACIQMQEKGASLITEKEALEKMSAIA